MVKLKKKEVLKLALPDYMRAGAIIARSTPAVALSIREGRRLVVLGALVWVRTPHLTVRRRRAYRSE